MIYRKIAGAKIFGQLAVSGLPAGVTASFSQNNFVPPSNITLTLSNLFGVPPGNYAFTVTATGGQWNISTNLSLSVPGQVTSVPNLSTPADGAEVTIVKPKLTWSSVSNAFEYYVEVSESPDFGSLFTSGTVNNANFQLPIPCNEFGVYYWRVRAQNPCSQSSFSPVYAFHIGDAGCETFTAVGLPLDIPTTSGSVTATVNVPENIAIASVKANLNISHANVGDLIARLTSPQATVLQVFNRPGVPSTATGCNGDDIVASFSDAFGSSSSTFENACAATPPAISGQFRPSNAFLGYNGQSSQGNWSLKIYCEPPSIVHG
ncbi:MAG: proprotein convertase P-domain-containing protein [Saprospiraceae bacterium]|nr:proprotein convertase P-domain-containing protein [Saprospiraceae bacterium]